MTKNFANVLITGVTGSGASYLAEHLCNSYTDLEIHGISRWHSTSSQVNLKEVAERVEIHECDLFDFSSVLQFFNAVRPTNIFHLASHANVRAGFVLRWCNE